LIGRRLGVCYGVWKACDQVTIYRPREEGEIEDVLSHAPLLKKMISHLKKMMKPLRGKMISHFLEEK